MDRRLHLIGLILFLFIGIVNGYNWVALKSGDPLPKNVVLIENSKKKYIGRAQHFDDILPAEVDENGIALVSSCGAEILKDEFEILTSANECEWIISDDVGSRTILRVGKNSWNGESIFVGVADGKTDYHIASIYSKKFLKDIRLWKGMRDDYITIYKILCCEVKTEWVQSSAMKLPNNTVYGGKSAEGYDIFVARLKKDCDMIIGQAIPELNIAKAHISFGKNLVANNFEVLVGEPNEYTWIPVGNREIPDHAVVIQNNYVARLRNAIFSMTRYQVHSDCEVLAKY